MIKIYDYKTGKLREVILDPGDKHYLLKENNKRVKDFNDKAEQEKVLQQQEEQE